jgi:hypothetical protein
MKVKVKFDLKKIQEFLLQNVEKIVLGAVVFVFLMMLYSALAKAGRFGQTPDQLQTQAATGRREMEATTFEEYVKEKSASQPSGMDATVDTGTTVGAAPAPTNSGLVLVDYVSQAERSQARIEEKPYLTPEEWDPPLFARRPLRDEPPLFAVQHLQGSAGVGAFTMAMVADSAAQPGREEASGFTRMGMGSTRGQRWVVVTGLVPIEKQEMAYAETFRLSPGYDPQSDYPAYLGYWIERVEVSGADEAANLDWSKAKEFMSRKEIEKAIRQWQQARGNNVVGQEYLENRLTFPLGPLVGRDWDASVAHEPKIPILKSEARRDMGPAGMMGRSRQGGPGTERMRGNQMSTGPQQAGPGMDRGGNAGAGTPFDNNRAGALDRARGGQGENALSSNRWKAPAYKLFRFFDFNVEPGKQYVYRVRLALRNPNSGVKKSLLKRAELAKETFLKTKWSNASPPISVPRDTRVLTVAVKPAHGVKKEPTGKILAIRWASRKGVEVYEEFNVVRGQVANFANVVAKVVVSGVRKQANLLKASLNSGATVIDMRGGDRIPGVPGARKGSNLKSVGQILLLDSGGNLIVRNELDDLPTYERTTVAPEPTGLEIGVPGGRTMPERPGTRAMPGGPGTRAMPGGPGTR